jgi:cytidylate kinase
MAIHVTISWAAGAGKSTVIDYIVQKLWYESADVGQIFRSRAVAKWLTIAEYDKHIEQNPQEDKELDYEFKEFVQKNPNNTIVSRRLGFYFLPEALSIRLEVSPEEGAERIFLQDRGKQEKKYTSVEEAMKSSQERMTRMQQRIKHVYGVDFMDKNNYKKIIDTNGKTAEQTAEEVVKIIKEYEQSQG